MWATLRGLASAGNAPLRNLARKNNSHLFDDIGLSREDYLNLSEEQMRKRFWWYR